MLFAGFQEAAPVAESGQGIGGDQPQQLFLHLTAFGHIHGGAQDANDIALQIAQEVGDPGEGAPFAVPGQNIHVHRFFRQRRIAGDNLLEPATNQVPMFRRNDDLDQVLADQILFRIAENFRALLIEHRYPAIQVQRHQ